MNFGNNLKDLRETWNITQGQLAEYLQVSRPTIACCARCERRICADAQGRPDGNAA